MIWRDGGAGSGEGVAYEEKTSPKKALSLAIRGRVFVNSVWALA